MHYTEGYLACAALGNYVASCANHIRHSTTHQPGNQRGWACPIGDKNPREVESYGLLGYFCTKIIIFCTKIEPITIHYFQAF